MGQVERTNHDLPRRHYTSQVVPGQSPVTKTENTKKDSKAKPVGKIVLVLVVIVLIGSVIWYFKSHKPDPLPASIKNSVSIPLYYPTAEPKGYDYNPSTVKKYNGSVFYSLTNSSNHAITISQQPLPKGFDPKTLFEHNPYPTTVSPLGTIYDLSYKNQSRYMLVTNDSLIYITSTPKITNTQLEQIVNGLKISK